jgi:RNA polymerase sigma-70 factor (ECF subfamily)
MMATTNFVDNDRIGVAELVRAAQAGDREAFGELFERFERHVFAIALRRLGDYTEAQELCQDVFVQAMVKLEQLREPECFGSWLRSITQRMAINRIVRRHPDIPTEPEMLAATCVQSETPLAEAIRAECHDELRAGLRRLGDMDRETLEAFYVKGQSLLEMADEFDAPLGTIKRRLHVARKRLARQVEPVVAV